MNDQNIYSSDEMLRKKFSGHRFVISPIGILKLIGSILFLASATLSLALQVCIGDSWLKLTFPILIATCGVISIVLYACSILGLAKRMPNTWVKLDISLSGLISVVTFIFSILILTNCNDGKYMTILTGVICIVGIVCLVIGSAMLFISWRNIDEDAEDLPRPPGVPEDFDPKRKSIFI